MANDRMYLRCPCGSHFGVAKRYGGPWYTTKDDIAAALDTWFQDHAVCDLHAYPAKPTVVFESDPDFTPGLEATA